MELSKIETLKKINRSHTFSKFGAKLIDDLIDKHTLVCFVHGGIIYDFDSYRKQIPGSFSEPFRSSVCRDISDFWLLESLARLVFAEQSGNRFWATIAFADREIIDDDMRSLNTSLGFPNDELIYTKILDAGFSLQNVARQIISQPFVSFGVSKESVSKDPTVQFACLNIQDGDTFLFIS